MLPHSGTSTLLIARSQLTIIPVSRNVGQRVLLESDRIEEPTFNI